MRSLLFVESFDLCPSNQYTLVRVIPSCFHFAKMCLRLVSLLSRCSPRYLTSIWGSCTLFVGVRAGRIVYSRLFVVCSSCPDISARWGRPAERGELARAQPSRSVEILQPQLSEASRSYSVDYHCRVHTVQTVDYTLYTRDQFLYLLENFFLDSYCFLCCSALSDHRTGQ
jgi:hypothetical protein